MESRYESLSNKEEPVLLSHLYSSQLTMEQGRYSQSLPDFVKIRCYTIKTPAEKFEKPAEVITTSTSIWPADLLEGLAGPTRTIDPTTNILMAADGSCPRLCFGISLDLVWDDFHIRSAIYRAFYSLNTIGRLKAKSLPAEVLYQLAATGKINEAIKQFCMKDSSISIAVISLASDPADNEFEQYCQRIESLSAELPDLVSAVDEIPLSELGALGSTEKRFAIAKTFKMTPVESGMRNFGQSVCIKLALKDIEN